MSYQQLTREQRYQIYALMKAGHNQTEMAALIGVHKSTISREFKRNQGRRGYRPKQAHEFASARQQQSGRARIEPATWAVIESYLRQEWSPEQISGFIRREQKLRVSHERIYQHIYRDQRRGGTLHEHLRCRKRRRKRYGHYDRRGRIQGRRSIDDRPKIVDARRRIGDWEADTIIGGNHQQAIVSLVERKSKLCLLKKVEHKTARAVGKAVTDLLRDVAEHVHTITSDNGKEFADHQQVAQTLEAQFYFAHPYAAWERGLNENTNGLVRQYFPKRCDFTTITDAEVNKVMLRLNTRPRKTLGFRTPQQVFFKQQSVALQC